MLEFAINNRINSSTKQSLFFFMYRSHLKGMPTAFTQSKVLTIFEWMQKQQHVQEEAKAAMDHAAAQMAKRLNYKFTPFQQGQKVWLEMKHHSNGYLFHKLAPKQHKPFKIQKVLSRLVYQLSLSKHMKIHPMFHASLLLLYHETGPHGPNYVDTPSEIVDDHEEYELEAILAHKPWYRSTAYLIQ
jgi:hypothetical protein